MRARAFLLVTVVALAFAGPALAQYATPFHLIPVVAKTAGAAGTDWRSDVSISNLSAFPVTVGVAFFREATGNSFPLFFPVNLTLQAGETRTVEDVLGTLFPSQGNTKGALFLLGEPADAGDPDDVLLSVTSRTYNNADPLATYGQGVDSSFLAMVWGTGTSVLTGIRHDQRFRSNVGALNLGPQSVQLLLTTYNAAGAQVAQSTKTVESFSIRQWSLADLGVASIGDGRTEVQVDPATITWDPCSATGGIGFVPGFFLSYLSKVDQATGDAEFHLGQVDWTDYVTACGEDPGDPECP